jgi:nucleoside-diphosphate-sugar epimerase
VYISTTGVYGHCNGERVSETRPRRATTPRAQRRVDAEQRLRRFAAQHGIGLSILRVPGIYASTRLPLPRLRQGTPALMDEDDVYTNHVHADDLARAAIAALYRGRPNRAYNVSDDSELKMGEWFDLVADAFRLPRAPRVTRDVAQRTVTPALLSFMNESRRLSNRRMKRELRVSLAYPTPHAALAQAAPHALTKQLALPIGDEPTQRRNHAR